MVQIVFRDGSHWSLHSAPAILTGSQAHDLARFVAERAGVEVDQVSMLDLSRGVGPRTLAPSRMDNLRRGEARERGAAPSER